MNGALIFPETIQRFTGSLLHFVWQGAAIAMIAAAGLRMLRHRTAEARYAFAIGALACMLAAPLLTLALYAETGAVAQRLVLALHPSWTESRSATTALQASVWAQRILVAWLAGVLVFAARLVVGWRLSWQLVKSAEAILSPGVMELFDGVRERLGLRGPIRLLAHFHIDSPMVVGWLRPAVLLPISLISGFTPEQLSAVFAHELAHIRRHDFAINILQRSVEAILFYHPAVWWLSKRIRAEREHCCDDVAISLCGSRKIYAEVLIEMERARQPRPSLSIAAADGAVLQRFRRVLGMSTSDVDWQSAVGALLFLGVWVVIGMWQSGGTLQAKPATASSPALASLSILPAASVPGTVAESLSGIAEILMAQAPGIISGQIRLPDGTPAVDVRVAAITTEQTGPDAVQVLPSLTATDSSGRFKLEGLPPGRYYVVAGMLGAPTYFPGVKTAEEARSVSVVSGANVANVDFTLARSPGVRVQGSISGLPVGLPAGLARVLLQPAAAPPGSPAGLPLETDVRADGTFEFSRIAPESYAPRIVLLDLLERAIPAPAITVGERGLSGVELSVPLTVAGRVEVEGGGLLPVFTSPGCSGICTSARTGANTAPDARSVAQIQALAQGGATDGNLTVPTRADGFFLLSGISGDYQVSVSRLPFGYYVRSISYETLDLSKTPLHIDSVKESRIRVVLATTRPEDAAPEFRVTGRLIGLPEGAPASSRSITFSTPPVAGLSASRAVSRAGEAQIHADGTFEVSRVPPGTWNVSVLDVQRGISRAVKEVVVIDRDVTGVELEAQVPSPSSRPPALSATGPFKLSGRVIAPKSTTLPSSVTMSARPGPSQQAAIQPDGTFSFSNMPAGNFTLSASGPFGGASVAVVIRNRDVDGIELVLPEVFELRGRFVLEGAASLPPELLRLRIQAASPGGSPYSPFLGGLIRLQLPAGEYRISVLSVPNGYVVDSVSYGSVDLLKSPLTVDGPLPSEIVVRLSPFPSRNGLPKVSGRITGLPAAPYVEKRNILMTRNARNGGGVLQTVVNGDGTFEFKRVPPGEYVMALETLNGLPGINKFIDVAERDVLDVEVHSTASLSLFTLGCSSNRTGLNCFDRERRIVLEGVFKSFDVRNPRMQAVVTVVDRDGSREIELSGPSAGVMVGSGFGRDHFKAGDRARVVINPRWDGGSGGYIIGFLDADGKETQCGNVELNVLRELRDSLNTVHLRGTGLL